MYMYMYVKRSDIHTLVSWCAHALYMHFIQLLRAYVYMYTQVLQQLPSLWLSKVMPGLETLSHY